MFSMIAKILRAASSFAGITYSEKKNEQGRSELLAAKNFNMGISNPKKSDYVNYMERICETNKNVKNVQFHATISCKGRQNSPEELKAVAEEYIKRMGYGNNPYLIYFHSDTNNNHVHIVSPRVDREGNKIDDRFERVRSQKVMNEIQGIDLKAKADQDVKKALEYKFSSPSQFRLLLESAGWNTQIKGNSINLISGGLCQYSISKSDIEHKGKNNVYDEKRKEQLSAIFHKYKSGMNHLELQRFLGSKFGVELVFHTGKGHTKPYGFSVIDHKGRGVYKGSQIMDLEKLLHIPDNGSKIEHCNNIVAAILNSNKHTMETFSSEMKKVGYNFSVDGIIKAKGEGLHLMKLDDNVLKELRYNSRVVEANKFNASSKEEAAILSRLFFVKQTDIRTDNPKKDHSSYAMIIQSYLYNSNDIGESLRNNNMSVISDRNGVFLLDKANKTLVSERDLGIPLSNRNMQSVTINTNSLNDSIISDNAEAQRGKNIIDVICDILGGQNMNVQADKKRKRRGQQQN